MGLYNAVQKLDQNGEVYRGVAFSVPVIKQGERSDKELKEFGLNCSRVSVDNKNKERAIRRAKANIKDYVKTNIDLRYFVTYTLDPSKMDRYDAVIIYSKVRSWLMNGVNRKGFKYILVPEKHKDGAWHFHGFTNIALKWKYGFSVCKDIAGIRNRNKCIGYIVSYIKKDMEMFNGRYYLHSNNLDKPGKVYSNVNFQALKDCYCMELEGLGVKVKIWEK